MQIYALSDGKPILAKQAQRSLTYHCPECGGSLRVRGGPSKQIHFYHLSSSIFCRQHQKSEEHIQSQLYLASQTQEEALLEHPFSEIQRIADVAWEKEKLIFEVQCSPISLDEARARCEDYEKMGYAVLWILHDKQFNRNRVSAAEEFLRSRGAYYTNMTKRGEGMLYDQFDVICKGKRVHKGPPLPLSFCPLTHSLTVLPDDLALPRILENRLLCWRRSLRMDLMDRISQKGSLEKTAKGLLATENLFFAKRIKKRLPWLTLLQRGYLYFIKTLLKGVEAEGLVDTCSRVPLQNKNKEIPRESQEHEHIPYTERGFRV